MGDLTQFHSGWQAAIDSLKDNGYNVDSRLEFADFLKQHFADAPAVMPLNTIVRLKHPLDKKPGDKSGWAILYEVQATDNSNPIGVGVYGCFRMDSRETWVSKRQQNLTPSERHAYNEAIQRAQEIQQEQAKKLADDAAIRAANIYASSPFASNTHEYLQRKGIADIPGLKLSESGALIVPAYVGEQITSLQFIAPDGQKKFMKFGRMKGAYFRISGSAGRVFVCEGMATGATIKQATDATVYCAFNVGNLFEVASYVKKMHPDAVITIAGDDDKWSESNAGRMRGSQVAEALGISVVFPVCNTPGHTDFNDMAKESSLDAVREVLLPKNEIYQPKPKVDAGAIPQPQGVMRDIVDYYNMTAGAEQPLFAIQTAIAVCSVICSRYYRTNFDNHTSLFIMNIARSGAGKEDAKRVTERVLDACGLDGLISGEGYTSSAAVINGLQDRPRHINIIDEFSKYLQSANAKNSNGMLQAAITELMKAFSKAADKMRPMNYANTGVSIEKRKQLVAAIHKPAITLLTMTTPSDFFDSISISQIKDGFLNRFLVAVSDAERQPFKYKERVEVPESIKQWADIVTQRHGYKIDDYSTTPATHTLFFTQEALQIQQELEEYKIARAKELESFSMDDIVNRIAEIGARLALIHALSRNPMAESIEKQDAQFGSDYVRLLFNGLIERCKGHMSGSEFEGWKMDWLKAIRETGERGVTESEMQRKKPYSLRREREQKEIIESLIKGDLIYVEEREGRGRPAKAYFAKA